MTLPSVTQRNGIGLGLGLIIFGALISWYSGMLLISCADKAGSDKYEDFAALAFGPRMAKFTGWCILICMLGFVVSYIVFVKTLIPHILTVLFYGEIPDLAHDDPLPLIIGRGQWSGQIFWATVYCFFILFPISLPRKLSALRFSSLFGFCCSFYLVSVITLIFFFNKNLVPSSKA
jgi:amino acid permease